MRLFSILLMALLMPLVSKGQNPPTTANALDRIIEEAQKSSSWRLARSQSDRFAILRERALLHEAAANPISDRYVITALAGPIDLVHFFGLARSVCSGKDRRAMLHREWQREGGSTKITQGADSKPSDCTPDDLPSNALGALFGEETKPHDADLTHDLTASLRQFFAKLEPVSDSIIQSQSHESLVLGLKPDASQDDIRASQEWFTAQPLYIIPVVAPDRAASIPNAAAALTAAGLLLRQHEGQPIVIDRVGTPEPAPPPSVVQNVPPAPAPAPPVPAPPSVVQPAPQPGPMRPIAPLPVPPKIVKAVPVDEPAPRPPPKAIPVD